MSGLRNFGISDAKPVTIASGQTTSDAFALGNGVLAGIDIPAEFDGSQITFTASATLTGTYKTLVDKDGNPITIACTASTYVLVDPSDFIGARFIKVVAGTAQSTSDTVLNLIVRN